MENQVYDLTILDTIFISKDGRGRGYCKNLIQDLIETYGELGFSSPMSNGMLICILRFLKQNPGETKIKINSIYIREIAFNLTFNFCIISEYRENMWSVSDLGKIDEADRKNIWWSAVKLCRERNLDLKQILNLNKS